MIKTLTLVELEREIVRMREAGARDDSPVIVEGRDDEGLFVQASIGALRIERRCEDDDEPIGVYVDLIEAEFE